MGSGYKIDMVDFVELGHHISTEEISRASGRETPSLDVLRIRPHEIAHGTVVRNFLFAVNYTDLIGDKKEKLEIKIYNGANIPT
jgi:hypothetical protein